MSVASIQVDGKLTQVFCGPITLWYSYTTLVAFQVCGCDKVVSENYWTRTTSQHLNEIDRGAKHLRVKKEEFQKRWSELETALNHLASSKVFGGI